MTPKTDSLAIHLELLWHNYHQQTQRHLERRTIPHRHSRENKNRQPDDGYRVSEGAI